MDEQEQLLRKLYAILDDGGTLDDYQQGVFDTLNWVVDGTDKPEINN